MKAFLLDMVCDADHRVSSSRVMMTLTFVVSTLIMLWLTYFDRMSGEYFGMYLGFGSGTFSFAKWVEKKDAPVPKQDTDASLRPPKA